jgi:hypothetical protein
MVESAQSLIYQEYQTNVDEMIHYTMFSSLDSQVFPRALAQRDHDAGQGTGVVSRGGA